MKKLGSGQIYFLIDDDRSPHWRVQLTSVRLGFWSLTGYLMAGLASCSRVTVCACHVD